MHTRHVQESLANAKVSARQQHVYEGRPATSKEIYGNSANQRKERSRKVHSVGFNAIADNMGLSSFV